MKERMKRLLCTLLAACLLCGAAVTASAAGAETGSSTCGNGLTWQFEEETGVLTIQGSGPMYDFEDEMNLPWSQYLKQIKKVMVVYGVTSIGKNAFAGCTALEEISLPETVTAIGADVFKGCGSLRKVICTGEEAQVNQVMKNVDLNGAELIIIPIRTAQSGTTAPVPTTPVPTAPEPTVPDSTVPAPTVPDPTVAPTEPTPTEPVERTTVRYEQNMRITETWLGDQLIFRRDEPLDDASDGWCTLNAGVCYIEYTDFTDQNQPRKVTEYGRDLSNRVGLFDTTVVTSVTTMEYDKNGVLVSESCSKPTGEKVYESEIANGVKIQDVYANGTVCSYEYDEDGRLAKETYGDVYNQQFLYDENGELTEILENNGGWKNIYGFEQGQLISYDMQGGDTRYTATHERNENGQLVKRSGTEYWGERLIETEEIFQYDENGELMEESYRSESEGVVDGYSTIKYSKGENGEKIKKEFVDGFKGMPYYVTVFSADETVACQVAYDVDPQGDLRVFTITYAKQEPNDEESSYSYTYGYDNQTGEWDVWGYEGAGIYDEDGVIGTAPTADDPLLKYLMSIDPTADPAALMAMLAELDLTELEAIESGAAAPEEANPEFTAPETAKPETDKYEVIEAEATKPDVTKPEVTEPEATEPEVTEPKITEYEVAEPEVIVSGTAEPVVTPPTETAAA